MNEEEKNNTNNTTENLKQETMNTVNQVKDTIKNVDIKKDSMETKGLIKDLFVNPIGKIQEIVSQGAGKFLKYAIILLVIWTVAVLLKQCFTFTYWRYTPFLKTTLEILKVIVAPVLTITIMSLVVLMRNKGSKKSLTDIITAITIAHIPTVIASVISLLTIFGMAASYITGPISGLCSVITIILSYFTIKSITEEKEDATFIKNFVIIQAIYYVAYFAFVFLGIYI